MQPEQPSLANFWIVKPELLTSATEVCPGAFATTFRKAVAPVNDRNRKQVVRRDEARHFALGEDVLDPGKRPWREPIPDTRSRV